MAFPSHEDGSYKERVHHIELAHALYSVLLPTVEATSLLGRRNMERRKPRNAPSLTVSLVVGADGERKVDLLI